MRRSFLLVLSVVVIGAAVSGCQSDAQKMDKGLAKTYQERYQHCLVSIERFKKYAGFDFVEEKGVCQCNGVECSGEQICNQYAQCKGIDSVNNEECDDGAKICISPKIGQICKDKRWSAPITCEGNDVCDPLVPGDSICASECSDTVCFHDDDGHYYEKCIDGTYENVKTVCQNASCTLGENNTSNCGECKNGEARCQDEISAIICENGRWPNKNDIDISKINNCVLCENDKCYKKPICMTVLETGIVNVVSIATDGGRNEVPCNGICENGVCVEPCEDGTYKCINDGQIRKCSGNNWNDAGNCPGGCKEGVTPKTYENDNAAKAELCTECLKSEYKCEDGKIYACTNEHWGDEVISTCPTECKENGAVQPISDGAVVAALCASAPEPCDAGTYKCVDKKIYACTNEHWDNEVISTCPSECKENGVVQPISDGAVVAALCAPESCEDGTYKCNEGQISECSSNTWNNAGKCTDGCSGDETPRQFENDAEAVAALCACKENTYKCVDKNIYKCTGKQWSDEVNLTCQSGCKENGAVQAISGGAVEAALCACEENTYKCINGQISRCSDNNWNDAGICLGKCKGEVTSQPVNDVETAKAELCADGSEPSACDGDYYYVCKKNESVGKCSFESGINEDECPGVADVDMLMINSNDKSFSLCSGGNWNAKCDEFPDKLEGNLIERQNEVCTNPVGYSICFGGCACEQFDDSFDGKYYVNLSNAHNYQAMTQFFVIWEEDEDGEQGTCELCINTDY